MLGLAAISLGSAVGLWIFIRLAPRLGLLDQPNHRSMHSAPTAVGGGVVPAILIAGYLLSFVPIPGAQGVAGLLLMLSLIGLSDDRWGLPSAPRLASYLFAGVALPLLIFPTESFPSLTALIALGFMGVAVAWCINLFNFMDGADGLATMQLLSVSLGLGLIAAFGSVPAQELVWCCGLLFASCLPLLVFNWPPAKVFMGDAGAIPLGFFLAVLGALAAYADIALGVAWCVLMMPFLVDTGFTLSWRLFSGEPPHVAHRDHAYQRLALRMGSPLPVTLGLMALQVIWQFPLAVTSVNNLLFPPLVVLLSAIPSILVVVYSRARQ
jgi:Fuc2NAc and GlcNAc transferase